MQFRSSGYSEPPLNHKEEATGCLCLYVTSVNANPSWGVRPVPLFSVYSNVFVCFESLKIFLSHVIRFLARPLRVYTIVLLLAS